MADCGSAGTALDRAARLVAAAASGGVASKQVVSNIIGHAAVGSHQSAAMHTSAPDHLMLPGNDLFHYAPSRGPTSTPVFVPVPPQTQSSSSVTTTTMDSVWNRQPRNLQVHGLQVMPQHHPLMLHTPPPMINHHLRLMQHQEQQRHLLLQHEMATRLHMLDLGRQAELRSTMERNVKNTPLANVENISFATEDVVANLWHEGLDDDVRADLDDDNLAHEGMVSAATIDELSAAWAQAEAEYERDLANLWVGESQAGEEPPLSYEFSNKDAPPAQGRNRDWLQEGMQQFREGNIKEAIYSFEMELQHCDPDNATAWKMLGRCHAENDQDRQAIACLEQAIERDPFCTEALLALGVSYVNELDLDRALLNLKAWITHNPKYAGLDLSEDVYGAAATATDARESAFEEVQRLLLRALEFDPADAADVHEALGVVYNVSRDYDAAVASFRKAIESHPDDYQLWNKLGATLANSNQSDKALPAYHRALQLKPKYARAWLNMAISHSNLQNYDEAARCYLQTLSLNPSAVHCWSYLRIALSCSERWDLIPFAASQDLKALRNHYDFIVYDT